MTLMRRLSPAPPSQHRGFPRRWQRYPEVKLQQIDPGRLDKATVAGWQQWWPAQVLLCPLRGRNQALLGLLLLAREEPFLPQELSLLEVLSDAYGHALAAFQSEARRGLPALSTKKRRTVGLTVASSSQKPRWKTSTATGSGESFTRFSSSHTRKKSGGATRRKFPPTPRLLGIGIFFGGQKTARRELISV